MTWGWVINERISIFVWTIPINYQHDPRSLFPVAAGLHQDSPLTLIPFAIFMDRISKYSREWRVSSLQPIVKRGGEGQHLHKSEAVVPSWKKVDPTSGREWFAPERRSYHEIYRRINSVVTVMQSLYRTIAGAKPKCEARDLPVSLSSDP